MNTEQTRKTRKEFNTYALDAAKEKDEEIQKPYSRIHTKM
jgi:hypothetical protein